MGAAGETRRRPDGEQRRGRPRILVIDDDDATCEMLREALTDEGYAVATVPHGAAALELVKHHQPAVILCDLRMPIMDGWSFIEQYRRTARPPAAIIVLTAVRDAGDSTRPLDVAALIHKPFELPQILAAISRSISAS